MSWEAVLGAVAGPLISGFLADDRAEDDRASANAQQERNTALQREFAQHGIRWRVEDAKAAGVHPLYALTGGGAAYAPNPVVLGGDASYRAGGHFGDALTKGLAAFFSASVKKDEALAAAALSNAALARSAAASAVGMPQSSSEWGWETPLPDVPLLNIQNMVDAQQFKPATIVSSRLEEPSLTPGKGPGGSVFEMAPGFRMILPTSPGGDVSEALEALSESWELAYMYVQRNVDAYGIEWLDKAQRYLPLTASLAKVINNIKNAATWVEPVFTGRYGSEYEWKMRHGVDRGARWVGRGLAPWDRGPTVSGRIRR